MPRYTHEIKERGFRIYYDTRNISEVVRVLRRDYPKLSKSTVHEWSQERDARGKTWDERCKETEIAHHDRMDETLAGERRKILREAQGFRERLYQLLPALEAKTLEGAVFAYERISKFILEQSGSDRDSEETARQAISALILTLKEDKEIAPVIERRWEIVEKRFYEILEKMRKSEAKK